MLGRLLPPGHAEIGVHLGDFKASLFGKPPQLQKLGLWVLIDGADTHVKCGTLQSIAS